MACTFMPKGIPNALYTGTLKQTVIENMRENKFSQNETGVKYCYKKRHQDKAEGLAACDLNRQQALLVA